MGQSFPLMGRRRDKDIGVNSQRRQRRGIQWPSESFTARSLRAFPGGVDAFLHCHQFQRTVTQRRTQLTGPARIQPWPPSAVQGDSRWTRATPLDLSNVADGVGACGVGDLWGRKPGDRQFPLLSSSPFAIDMVTDSATLRAVCQNYQRCTSRDSIMVLRRIGSKTITMFPIVEWDGPRKVGQDTITAAITRPTSLSLDITSGRILLTIRYQRTHARREHRNSQLLPVVQSPVATFPCQDSTFPRS